MIKSERYKQRINKSDFRYNMSNCNIIIPINTRLRKNNRNNLNSIMKDDDPSAEDFMVDVF